jgi:purine-binding chemotaxis protein CheW
MSADVVDNRYMEFRLGNQLFAIPLLTVKEVIRKPESTQVPNMPARFEGMMNLRGQILGVYNVRKQLGTVVPADGGQHDPENDVVIVIETMGVSVGMIVNEVSRVIHATQEMIRTAPVKEGDPAHRYVKSVLHVENDLVLVIDVVGLLELDQYSPRNGSRAG